jgi:hypothetical protein
VNNVHGSGVVVAASAPPLVVPPDWISELEPAAVVPAPPPALAVVVVLELALPADGWLELPQAVRETRPRATHVVRVRFGSKRSPIW